MRIVFSTLAAALLAGNAITAVAEPRDATLEEVVVTASPLTTDPDKSAGIVGKVNRDEILQQGGSSLADALGNTPGVTGSGFAAGANRPVIRGFDANRVKLMENGVGSFDVSDVGPDHGVPIDPLVTKSIEVVRGAATLRYGSQAIGGVVNAIDNRVPRELPDAPFAGEASGSYGTNANTGQGTVLANAAIGQFALHADVFKRHTIDYGIPGGVMANSWFRGKGGALGGSWFYGDGGRIGIAGIHYGSQYGIPGGDTYINMRQNKALFSSFVPFAGEKLKSLSVDGGYADYTHSEVDPATGLAASTFNDNEWDMRGEALMQAVGPFASVAAGVQLNHRDFSALGEGADYLLPTQTRSGAVFGFGKLPISEVLTFQLGARVEETGIRGTDAGGAIVKRNFTPVSASADLLYEPTDDITWGLTASTTSRAPAQTELFARGPHDGPGTLERGDAMLGAERANSLEASLRLRVSTRMRFDGSLWVSDFNAFIYGNLTGRTCDESGACLASDSLPLRELVYQQGGARFRGAEASLRVALSQLGSGLLSTRLLGDYVRASLDEGGNVPRIPPWHLGAGLFYEGDKFDAGLQAKYSAAQKHFSRGETPTAGYTSLDMHIGWRPFTDTPGVEVVLVGQNLTDSEQHNAVALNKDEVTLPGRNIRLMLNVDF